MQSDKGGGFDRILVGVLLVACALWMTRHHFEAIDYAEGETKARLHEAVLRGDAPDPYQYKLEIVSQAFEAMRDRTGAALQDVFFVNTLLSLLAFVFAHHLWLRTWVGRRPALVGAFLLAALTGTMFRGYQHHAYEFWGLAGYCLLLCGVARGWSIGKLAALGLLTGGMWEKHALIPPIEGVWRLARGKPFWRTLARGLVFLAACLAVPLGLRLLLDARLDGPRPTVDGGLALSDQRWDLILWYQIPYVLPFLLVLLASWRRQPSWVRALWLALPLLVAAYLVQGFLLYEVRSFWALAPVFTATTVIWLFPARRPPSPLDGETGNRVSTSKRTSP